MVAEGVQEKLAREILEKSCGGCRERVRVKEEPHAWQMFW